jgi:lipopolysaccharide export system protein LptA
MARSCRKYRASTRALFGVLAVLCAADAAAQAARAQPPLPPLLGRSDLPVDLTAKSSVVDYTNNTLLFTDVVISQGGTRVSADQAHATGLDFVNSRWTFEGKVRIDAPPRGNLRADTAVVEFKDNRIARATAKGRPADFEQTREGSDQISRGHADQIVYDVSDGTIRLTDDAWLSDGQNQISGPSLVYNVRAQRVQATSGPGAGERVHIIINPNSVRQGKGDASKSPSATPTPKPPGTPPS